MEFDLGWIILIAVTGGPALILAIIGVSILLRRGHFSGNNEILDLEKTPGAYNPSPSPTPILRDTKEEDKARDLQPSPAPSEDDRTLQSGRTTPDARHMDSYQYQDPEHEGPLQSSRGMHDHYQHQQIQNQSQHQYQQQYRNQNQPQQYHRPQPQFQPQYQYQQQNPHQQQQQNFGRNPAGPPRHGGYTTMPSTSSGPRQMQMNDRGPGAPMSGNGRTRRDQSQPRQSPQQQYHQPQYHQPQPRQQQQQQQYYQPQPQQQYQQQQQYGQWGYGNGGEFHAR